MRVRVAIYKAVAKLVLLYGSKSWVVTRSDVQGPDGISPSIGSTDHRDDSKTWGRRIVGVSSCRGGDGLRGVPPHRSIHQVAADNHSG